ncbi:MAG: hypothetical protein LBI91_04495 [Spirochaetaceae bacterium]|jgi:hypothetical protein|nr:hypothetical protein [Spirochaetaceae bacterium]
MLKISPEDRQKKFLEKIAPYTEAINAGLGKEKRLLDNLSGNSRDAALARLNLADEMFNIVSHYVLECRVFQRICKKHNEDLLGEARRALHKGIVYIENLVSPLVDVPFSDYEDKIAMLSGVSGERRYLVIRKMGLAIDLLKDLAGYSSKWRWVFVDFEGRLAASAKNIIDMRNMVANLSPRSEEYEATVFHLRMAKKLLAQAAERYREKYELSSQISEDFQQAINFLNALKRLHILLNERSDAEEIKKTVEAWSNKLKEDIRRKRGSPSVL